MSERREPRGFVAAIALYMLAAMAGIGVASFYTVVQVQRAAHRSVRQEEATSAADAGLAAAIRGWDVAKLDSLEVGAIDSIRSDAFGLGRKVVVIRLTESLFWFGSTGWAARGTTADATHSQNLLVEVLRPRLSAPAALVSGGNVIATAGLTIGGDDAPPPGWSGCPTADSISAPAILLPEGRSATLDDGSPIQSVRFDTPAVVFATSSDFGRVSRAMLAARPTFTVPPGAILSPAPDTLHDCRLGRSGSTVTDWGQPTHNGRTPSCEQFYPVINTSGDLTVAGGRGQGLLLVSGRLRIQGPFAFHGVVYAGGGIETSGPDVTIYGAVVSAGPLGVELRNGGALRRSSCAVKRVAEGAARPYPTPRRAWSELF